jgi:hypothetical protein
VAEERVTRVIHERASPGLENVKISGNSKGGTVLLIVGTLFVGYLYFTQRLPNVLKSIATPAGQTATTPVQPAPPVQPAQPAYPPGYRRVISIPLPAQYNRSPLTVEIFDPAYCGATVYAAVLAATQSPSLAAMYVQQYCT